MTQLVNKIRMQEAARLLLESDRQITEIAFRVGFNNLSYFNRLFKKLSGLSPREFRKRGSPAAIGISPETGR